MSWVEPIAPSLRSHLMNTLVPLAVAAAFAAACADGTLPARTARDPSSPDAPETPPPAGEVSAAP
ncbi:MAG TPA: hypothetical protein VN894_07180, partial [Polyangiaceae bacterium]|nr:hypothetical protein [Polyangiaceae bacterium]